MKKKAVVSLRPKARRPVKKEVKELTRLGAALRGLGGLGGSTLGALVGQPNIGGNLGRQLGAGLSKWLGSGDYVVSDNSIVEGVAARDSIPAMHKEDQSIIVRHKEFLGEISGSTTFTVQQSYNINPGLASTFPWLAPIAARFQEYNLRGMVFHYAPTSGTAVSSTSAALGSVMIQTSYRAGDNPPTNKQEMLNEYWSTETVPFESTCHPIECSPKENPYNLHYVRTGGLPTGSDQLLYDMGTTYVATSGMQSNNVVGDLWVTYEIELKKPLVTSVVTDPIAAYAAELMGAVTGTNLFGGAIVLGNGNLSDRITLSGNSINIAPTLAGWFYIQLDIISSSTFTSGSMASNYTATNCSKALTIRGSNVVTSPATTDAVFTYNCTVFKADTSGSATVTFPTFTFVGTIATVNVTITQRSSPLWA